MRYLFFILSLFFLFSLILTGRHHFVSDESWYLNQTGYLEKYGFTLDSIRHWHGSSGPLFGWLHWMLLPLTDLSLPAVRLVNASLFVVLILFQALTLKSMGGHQDRTEKPSSWLNAGWWFAIPVMWKLAGVAYTEMIALTCLSVSLFFAAKVFIPVSTETVKRIHIVPLLIACFFLGLSICGRQPFAGVILAALLVGGWHALSSKQGASSGFKWILFAFLSSVLPTLVFWQWKGLQPPVMTNQPLLIKDGVLFGMMSMGYLGLITLILKPTLLFPVSKYLGALSLLSSALIVFFLQAQTVLPGMGILHRLPLSEPFVLILSSSLSFCMTALGIYLFLRLVQNLWAARNQAWESFLLMSVLGLGLSHVVIGPVFSSRYLTLALPFLFLWLKPDWKGPWVKTRFLIGTLIGVLSLMGFLHRPQGPPFHDSRMEAFYPHLWQDRLPEVFSPAQWEKFDYGNSPWIQNPRVGLPIQTPVHPVPAQP